MYRIRGEQREVIGILFKEQCEGYNILDVLKQAEYKIEYVDIEGEDEDLYEINRSET